ncbi:hypothetical protein HYW60_02865 [Candidatus Kaiserbacteria bacterium]|nr:hypothetical protein [Candidatus Kaiserbacteria bacterium]
MVLRALGYPFAILAAAAWYVTIAALVIVYLIPAARTAPMPFYTGTVTEFFFAHAQYVFGPLIILNGLSGRWAPERLRQMDLWASRVGFFGTLAICFLVFQGLGSEGLSPNANDWLLVFTGFAIFDYLVNRGEDYRASSLRGSVPAGQPVASVAPAAVPLPSQREIRATCDGVIDINWSLKNPFTGELIPVKNVPPHVVIPAIESLAGGQKTPEPPKAI